MNPACNSHYCTLVSCPVLYCIVLPSAVFNRPVLSSNDLFCPTLYQNVPRCPLLCCTGPTGAIFPRLEQNGSSLNSQILFLALGPSCSRCSESALNFKISARSWKNPLLGFLNISQIPFYLVSGFSRMQILSDQPAGI